MYSIIKGVLKAFTHNKLVLLEIEKKVKDIHDNTGSIKIKESREILEGYLSNREVATFVNISEKKYKNIYVVLSEYIKMVKDSPHLCMVIYSGRDNTTEFKEINEHQKGLDVLYKLVMGEINKLVDGSRFKRWLCSVRLMNLLD